MHRNNIFQKNIKGLEHSLSVKLNSSPKPWKHSQISQNVLCFFRRILAPILTQIWSEHNQNGNFSKWIKQRSSRELWEAFLNDYLPDPQLKLLQTFAKVSLYTFSGSFGPQFWAQILHNCSWNGNFFILLIPILYPTCEKLYLFYFSLIILIKILNSLTKTFFPFSGNFQP